MPTEMSLSDFRADLSNVIRSLPATGPVRLVYHNDVVAEIRAAGRREHDSAYLQRWFALYERLERLALIGITKCGFGTYESATAFADLYEDYVSQGVDLPNPDFHILTEGKFTAEELIAAIYFTVTTFDMLEDQTAWFPALVEIERYAREKGMRPEFPGAYESSTKYWFVLEVKKHGHTPETLVAFCRQAMDQGVALESVLDLMGKDPIPADVLAMGSYSEWRFSQLIECGIPQAELVALYRRNTDMGKVEKLVTAGVKTASEITTLIDLGIDCDLAERAGLDGMTPDEWRPVMPTIQKYKYENRGILNFRLLTEAASRGLSLVRWDKNSVIKNSYWSHTGKKVEETTDYPWNLAYPDRVLELADAGVAPSFYNSYATYASKFYLGEHALPDRNLVDDLLALRAKGLTQPLLKAFDRTKKKVGAILPGQLATLLDLGITAAQVEYLGKNYGTVEQWVSIMQGWLADQPHATQWLEITAENPAWDDVRAVAEHYKATRKDFKEYEVLPMGAEAIGLLDTPERLYGVHVEDLLFSADWLLKFDEGHRYRQPFADILAGRTREAVEGLLRDFRAFWRNLHAPAVREDEETTVERVVGGIAELPSGRRAVESC